MLDSWSVRGRVARSTRPFEFQLVSFYYNFIITSPEKVGVKSIVMYYCYSKVAFS